MFTDRKDAGKELALRVQNLNLDNATVLALPRGGVVTGYEIASVLKAPLDVIISRKIGAPNNPEYAIGAIAEGDVLILNQEAIKSNGFTDEQVDEIASNEIREMERRIALYRNNRPLPNLKGKTVILADDGVATGITALAAIKSVEGFGADKIVFAAPVCAYESAELLKRSVDKLVCLINPKDLIAIGNYYKSFNQVSDDEVIKLLMKHQFNKEDNKFPFSIDNTPTPY